MLYPNTYDNEKRFVFNNWSGEDFSGTWNGQTTVVKAGETKEFPMYLAYHFTKHFVDREMTKDDKEKQMANEDERAPYEAKTIAEITAGMDSPALASLKEQIKKEVEEGRKAVKPKKEAKSPSKVEFADLKDEASNA